MAQTITNLPLGALIKFGKLTLDGEPAQPIVWEVVDHGHYPTQSASVTLISKYILDMLAYDAKETHLSHYQNTHVSTGGYNKYAGSNIDQWLNSDSPPGEWYTADHDGDTPPNKSNVTVPYNMRAGFLNAFSDAEKNAIVDTTIRCVNGLPAEGGAWDGVSTYYDITRKIYLPSVSELGLVENGEGTVFARYRDGADRRAYPSEQASTYSPSSEQLYSDRSIQYWLRTALEDSSMLVRIKSYYDANSASMANPISANTGVRPVMNLPQTLLVSDSVDDDSCYEIVWNSAPTAPAYINVPTIYGGKNNTISWGASTDPEGSTVRYRLLCNVNRGAYKEIYRGTSTSYTHFVELGTNTVSYMVSAIDNYDTESAVAMSLTKAVINNQSPVISGSDNNLGTLTDNLSVSYSVSDADGDSVTITEALDGTVFNTFTATLGNTYTCALVGTEWLKVLNGNHTLTIVATDGKGASTTRSYTFIKNVTTLSIITDSMESTSMPVRLAFSVSKNIPNGATFAVEVCNNGNDESPTWEIATTYADGDAVYNFVNTNKTADTWGVRIKVTVERNGATGDCYISGIGGNFE